MAIGSAGTNVSGVGSRVGARVGVAVGGFVGEGVADGIMVKSGVGVSVGSIWTAPTQDESKNTVNIMIERKILDLLMVFPFNDTLWANLLDPLRIPEKAALGKLFCFQLIQLLF
ncbi:MAG: hypothetical protein AB8I56_18690 [Anaerolineales bacterium]